MINVGFEPKSTKFLLGSEWQHSTLKTHLSLAPESDARKLLVSSKKGEASRLLLVKPLGDEMPYGTRQETAQKPENEGFQHQLFLCMGGVHTNAKDPTEKTCEARKNPASATQQKAGLFLYGMPKMRGAR